MRRRHRWPCSEPMACPDHDLLAQASHRRSGLARACRQEQHTADDGADACPQRNVDVLLLGDLKMRGANIGPVPLLGVVEPGMGLTIVRSILETHGGTIELNGDRRRKGATFKIRLPRKKARSTVPDAALRRL